MSKHEITMESTKFKPLTVTISIDNIGELSDLVNATSYLRDGELLEMHNDLASLYYSIDVD